MTKSDFIRELLECREADVLDFTRKRVLHGTPFVFSDREDKFYEFKKRISENLQVSFNDVFISGSGKLGFNPRKNTEFSLDSDIDVTIVSTKKYHQILDSISEFQMTLRSNRKAITVKELSKYHVFLEYLAIGWIRPDKLPIAFGLDIIKEAWFSFFSSISHGKSEVGNYKVSGAIFDTYDHYEQYVFSGIRELKNKLDLLEARNG